VVSGAHGPPQVIGDAAWTSSATAQQTTNSRNATTLRGIGVFLLRRL